MVYGLGVDGGNTKTVALIAHSDGSIIGWGRSGCSDIYGASSPQAALEQLDIAVTAAVSMAGVSLSELSSACFSLAGADWPEDFTFLQAELTKRGYGKQIVVINDAMGALRAGSPDGTGVVVVCGTGAAVGARSTSGRYWHSSFWQGPQGAVDLGKKALNTVYEAELGLQEPTSLTPRVLEFFQLPSIEEVLHFTTSRLTSHPPQSEIGKIARILLDEAGRGDPVALKLVEAHGTSLGGYATVAARRVGFAENEPFTLVLNGGVLRHESRVFADALIAKVHRTFSSAQPLFSRFEPAIGALFTALESAFHHLDDELRERIQTTMPPQSLFLT